MLTELLVEITGQDTLLLAICLNGDVHGKMKNNIAEQKYFPFLEKWLTPSRLAHSLGSMKVMGELAEVYGFDQDLAQIIGILHDAGKDLPEEMISELIYEGNIQLNHECENSYLLYLHGPVGAYFVQKELGITEEIIIDAIKTHTYYGSSRFFHDPVVWCLRFSDVLEPTRKWGTEKILLDCALRLEKLVYSGKIEEGAFLQTGCLIKWFEEKGMPVHPTMRKIKQEIGEKLGLDDTYLEIVL